MNATLAPTHRRVKITKYGCEDVRGAHCVWTVAGRTYLAEITDIYKGPTGSWMLCGKHMDGSATPDVAAIFVELLVRTYENAE